MTQTTPYFPLYSIGVSYPLSVFVDTYGTSSRSGKTDAEITQVMKSTFLKYELKFKLYQTTTYTERSINLNFNQILY